MAKRENPQMKATREVKQQRLSKQAKTSDCSFPSNISVTVVGSGSPGNPRCLCVSTDHRRYMFNCGEGTQRLAHEHGVKLSKLTDVFITQNTWENLGGLPGLLMSLQTIGVPEVNVHGPDGIENLHAITQSFSVTPEICVKYPSDAESNVDQYSDSVVKVKRVALHNCTKEPRMSKKLRTNGQNGRVFCYVCRFRDKPGKLLMEKCLSLNVPKGPLLGKLKNGEDVTLEDGTVVCANDVCGPSEMGPLVVVIDCPSLEYLDSLISCNGFNQISKEKEPFKLFAHFTPADVLNDERYRDFCSKFSRNACHLTLNASTSQVSFVGAIELQTRLNLLDSEIFPSLKVVNCETVNSNQVMQCTATGFTYVLRPNKDTPVDTANIASFDLRACTEEVSSITGLKEAIADYHSKRVALKKERQEYPKVVFLGTGSAMPSKQRNTACILIQVDEDVSYLFDCGEGSYGQFIRLFGENADRELSKIKLIFISHLHADHHLGLITLLQKRSSHAMDPVFLIAPTRVLYWLSQYSEHYEKINHLFRCVAPRNVSGVSNSSLPFDDVKLEFAKCVEVRHCRDSFGIVVVTKGVQNVKIVYSGDAMPTPGLVKEGMGCDLLIHEATMEDDMLEDAEAKRHSTMSQAIGVGKDMQAKFILLTHFSQRYAKMPLIKENFPNNVGIAFDNMQIKLSDLNRLPLLIEPMKKLFAEEYDEMVQRTELRLLRNIRD